MLRGSFIKNFSKRVDKDFKDVTQNDIQRYIDTYYKARASQESFKKFIKKFFKWYSERDLDKEIEKIRKQMLKEGKTQIEIDKREWEIRSFRPKYPMIVDWIRVKIVKTTKTEKDCLSPEQIHRLILASNHLMHKAMISLMWDCAMRVGQLCDIKLGDLIIDNGKIDIEMQMDEGERRVIPTTDSTPILFEWLNQHPFRNDNDRHLFFSLSSNCYGARLTECGAYVILKNLGRRAEIRKKVYPHLIRHSRTTFWKKNHVDSTTIKYIGLWKMNSTIPDTVYNHQVANDYRNNMICAVTGAPPPEFVPEKNPLQNIICGRCGEINASSNDYCVKCKEPITQIAKKKHQSELDMMKKRIDLMEQKFEEKMKILDSGMAKSARNYNVSSQKILEDYQRLKMGLEMMLNKMVVDGRSQLEIDEFRKMMIAGLV